MLGGPLFSVEILHGANVLAGKSNDPLKKRMVESDSLSDKRGIKSIIFFTARDSVVYNLDKRTMELRGSAAVSHDESSVKAPKIVIDLDSSLLHAFGDTDSLKTPSEPALFSDRQGSFKAESMHYNFITGSGETFALSSSSSGINFTGEHVSRLENGEMIIKDGTFTTCDDEDSHFWFSSSNMTIKLGSVVMARPLVMYIRPEIFSKRLPALPIFVLPYMLFPLRDGRSSGFLIPHLSSHDQTLFLSNFGYFWAINDYSDLRAEGDIAFNGSWRLGERFRYTKRDVFSSEIAGEYKHYPLYTDWYAKIVHNQVFDPSMRLDLNLQFQGMPHGYNLNSINTESMVSQQANARAALAKTFNDENSVAALYYNRSEDLSTLDLSQSVGLSFYQNRSYPFRSALSHNDWSSDVSISTGASIVSQFTSLSGVSSSGYSATVNGELGYFREFGAGSKALFTQGVIMQAREVDNGLFDDTYTGTSIVFPLRMQSTLFSHFNVNPSLTFVHSLHPESGNTDYSTTLFSIDASTRVYGVLESGFLQNVLGLKALRHTLIPVISYAWNPAFSGSGYDFSHHLYDWPYQNRANTAIPEGQSRVGVTLKNLFHAKFGDSSSSQPFGSSSGDQSKQLLSLSVSTGYDTAVDALHLSPLTFMASSNALSEHLLFSAGSMYDFYSYDPLTGVRINRLNRDDGNGLLRFVKGFLDMSLSVNGREQSDVKRFANGMPILMNTLQTFFNVGDFSSVDYSLPWELRFSLYLQSDRSNPLEPETTSLVNVAAKTALSKNWQMAVNAGYDFQNGELVLPRIQIFRNLHCWQMGVQWVPFGQFRSYALEIGLKVPESKDIRVRQRVVE